jgi:NADPH2:quinone reductase
MRELARALRWYGVSEDGVKSFSLFAQPAEVWSAAWSVICPLLQADAVKPIVAKTFPLPEAADALRYLIEGRPFGRVVLTI